MQKGKHSKRYPAGSMASANWRQFKGLLRGDGEPVQARIRESLEPARDHAALVESDRQNRFAAELWKAHAENALHLTDGQRELVRQALVDFGVQTPECSAEVMLILQKLG